MSLNEFSTKLRYFRAKIRPLLKPVVWIPALLVLPAGYFLTEYLTSPEAISFWEGLQTEQEKEAFSEPETLPTTAEKSKEQSKQQNQLSADQKLLEQLRLTNSQKALTNGTNAPASNQTQKLPEVGQSGGLDSLLLPAGASYNSNLGTNLLTGNKQGSPNQGSTIVPVNPLQAAMDKYSPSSSGGMGVSNAGSPANNVGVTGTVPSSSNPNGASYLEAATGIPTVPVSPPVMPTTTNSVSNTSGTGAQPNSYSYLTGSQPTTVNPVPTNPVTANPVPTNPVPVVQIVSPALQNSGTFVQNQGNGTVTQPPVSVPQQSTPPLNQVPLTPVPLTPVPIGPVNYGPSAVSGSSPSGMPANVGNYGQGFYPTNPSAGVMQPVMPAVGGYGSATYPNVPTGTANPAYPNPGVQPGVSSQPSSLPSAIGGGNINTFSNPTGSQ